MIKRKLVLFDQDTENSVLILEHLFNKCLKGHTTFCIAGVVSDKSNSKLFMKAEALGLPYYYFQSDDDYAEIVERTKGDLFLFYSWDREILLDESTDFKRVNVVCIFPGPWHLKGKINVNDYLFSSKEVDSAFSVYFYGKNKDDLSNLFSFIKVPICGARDPLSLERKVVKSGLPKLCTLLDYVSKNQITLNERGCLKLPEKWTVEFGRVNVK